MKDYLYRLAADYLLDADVKAGRERLRHRLVLVFCILCLIALLVIATKAHATEVPLHVLDKDGITIRLMNTPCVDPISVAMIRPDMVKSFKAIQSTWPEKDGSKKDYAGCWLLLKAGESGADVDGFLVVFADGESGFIPVSEFKKVKGQVGA